MDLPGYGIKTEPDDYEEVQALEGDEECRACKMWGMLQDGLCAKCWRERDEAQRDDAEESAADRRKEAEENGAH